MRHGVYVTENPTPLLPPVRTSASVVVAFGTAPVHLKLNEERNVNRLNLCANYAEAVELLGYHKDWEKYTLCEVMDSQFSKFAVSPLILVNVLDPDKHRQTVAAHSAAIFGREASLGPDIMLDTVVVKTEADALCVRDVDYSVAYDDEGNAIVTALEGGALAESSSLKADFARLDPSMVTSDDIVGGIDILTGDAEGLELLDQIFPKFRLIPGLLIAPGWSHNPEVAAVMDAKIQNVNGLFKGICLVDIPSGAEDADRWSKVIEWKSRNNISSPFQIACWPLVRLGD
ncbi:MAG: phage tail sheath family protein, partial [Synergistaceae bacterium]|nr:phage tail sheath family protein [Synergistaceae bacterium]